jgi:integrase
VSEVTQTQGLERRHVVEDHTRSMPRDELDRLFTRRDVNLRDRCLWRLLYETGARANEVLNLNVEDVDLDAKRAVTTRKGGRVNAKPARVRTYRINHACRAGIDPRQRQECRKIQASLHSYREAVGGISIHAHLQRAGACLMLDL